MICAEVAVESAGAGTENGPIPFDDEDLKSCISTTRFSSPRAPAETCSIVETSLFSLLMAWLT